MYIAVQAIIGTCPDCPLVHYLLSLAFGLFDLQLAYVVCSFIRNRRYSLTVFSGFFYEEYLIARVDFIVALRRTKGQGRRDLRIPPSLSSGL